jgi:hypothetical protein
MGRNFSTLSQVLLFLGLVGCSSSSSGEKGSNGQAVDCSSVCQLTQLSCTAGSTPGTATIQSTTNSGCEGIIGAGGETPPLYIHCDTGQICVEHDDECFAGTFTATSFSYTVPGKNAVSCSAE